MRWCGMVPFCTACISSAHRVQELRTAAGTDRRQRVGQAADPFRLLRNYINDVNARNSVANSPELPTGAAPSQTCRPPPAAAPSDNIKLWLHAKYMSGILRLKFRSGEHVRGRQLQQAHGKLMQLRAAHCSPDGVHQSEPQGNRQPEQSSEPAPATQECIAQASRPRNKPSAAGQRIAGQDSARC